MNPCKTVNEAFGGKIGWINGGGIFSFMDRFDPPWAEEYPSSIPLDRAYHGMFSGNKIVSPLVLNIADGETLSVDEKRILGETCWTMFRVSWEKEWATLSAQYNPIENYSMVEQMTGDTTTDTFGHINTRTLANSHMKTGTEQISESGSSTRTDNLTDARTMEGERTKTGTVDVDETGGETRTDNLSDAQTLNLSHAKTGTETQTPNVTLTEQENTFGFNTVSVDGEPTRKKTQTSTGNQQTTYNTTDADTGTDTTLHTGTSDIDRDNNATTTYNTVDGESASETTQHTGTQQNTNTGTHTTTHNVTDADSGTVTDAESGSNTHRRDYQLTRSGNIGVTTSQQMLQSERELWMFNFFRDVVFPDIDSVLTIPAY